MSKKNIISLLLGIAVVVIPLLNDNIWLLVLFLLGPLDDAGYAVSQNTVFIALWILWVVVYILTYLLGYSIEKLYHFLTKK